MGPVGVYNVRGARADVVVKRLRSQYPDLGMAVYRQANGFHVKGPGHEMDRLEHNLPDGVTRAVTLKLPDWPRDKILAAIAAQAEMELFLDARLEGTMTLDVHFCDLTDAISRTLPGNLSFRLLQERHAILVTSPERLAELERKAWATLPAPRRPAPRELTPVRQEFILEAQLAEKVVDYLIPLYPNVRFVPHPTMNGFYAIGPKKDILAIKGELLILDRVPSTGSSGQ